MPFPKRAKISGLYRESPAVGIFLLKHSAGDILKTAHTGRKHVSVAKGFACP